MDPPSPLLSHAEIVALNEVKRQEKEREKAEVEAKLAEQEAQKVFAAFDIIFIRHGESDGNAKGLCQGFTPGTLTPKGLVQARAVGAALFLENEQALDIIPYDEVYCSDLKRVKETLSTALSSSGCADALSAKTIFTHLLREKNAGIFEMRPRRLMVDERKRHGDERTFKPRNGESWEDLQKRVREFLELVKSTPKGSHVNRPWRVLVFTSGGVIKEFVNAFVYSAEIEEKVSSCESNRLWLAERKYYPNIAENGSMYVFRAIGRNRFEMIVENFLPPLPELESKSTDENGPAAAKSSGGKIDQKEENSKQRSVPSAKGIQKAPSKTMVDAKTKDAK